MKRSVRRYILAATVVALVASGGTNSVAQDVDEATMIAQQALQEGNILHLKGEHAEAILMWEKGYQIHGAAIFRHNQALAARKLGNREKAIEFAELAVADNDVPLGAAMSAKNDAYLRAWYSERAALRTIAKVEAERKRALEASAFRPSWKMWTGGSLVAVGLGLGVGAFVLSEQASDLNRGLGGLNEPQYSRERDKLEDKQVLGKVLLFSGIGAGIVGAALVAWDIVNPNTFETLGVGYQKGGATVVIRLRWSQ